MNNRFAALGAAAPLPVEEESSSSLLRLLLFAALFIGPAILKSIKESRAKRKESAEREAGGAPIGEALEQTSAPADTVLEESTPDSGSDRTQWERLMRGELATPAPALPPPIPVAPRRRVLTETRALRG